MSNENGSNKSHTGLIVAIVILIVLIGGGLASCYACGSAVDSAVNGKQAGSVSSDGSTTASTESSSSTEQAAQAVELFNQEGITVTAIERGEQLGMAYYKLEITNGSNKNVYVQIDNVSVNGVMADTWFYEDVASGKTAQEDLTLTNVNSMDELVNVEGTITITDSDSFSAIATATFTIA